MMKHRQIILASSSPRRKELLAGLGLKFLTHSSEVDETVPEHLSPEQIVGLLSLRKAKAVATCYNEGIVIGSDTIVVLNGQVLGKPKDQQDAYHMLQQLQGRTHIVYSGIAIIDVESNQTLVTSKNIELDIRDLTDEEIYSHFVADIAENNARDETITTYHRESYQYRVLMNPLHRNMIAIGSSMTRVKMKSLTEDQIIRYIASGEGKDKAGSYGIQGLGASLVEKIDGDYFTVVGLPIPMLTDMISDFDVYVP